MFRYILFNKPDGVVSTFTDDANHRTLKEFIPIPGVYTAGRLDLDSEGLLLLTNDGAMIHRLTDPGQAHTKTYLVLVEGVVTDERLSRLRRGVAVNGYTTRPAVVDRADPPAGLRPKNRPVTPHGPTAWLKITLTEGKKHEIRHMTAAVGLPTLRIIRIAIGSIEIGDLKPGDWRDLTSEERSLLVR